MFTLIYSLTIGLVIVLYWVGRRGRTVGTAPTCRTCGYNLTGTPETSLRCSECGADLRRPRALRVGHHHPRTWAKVLAVILLIPTLLLLGLDGYRFVRTYRYLRVYPASWLISELHAPGMIRQYAAEELRRRIATHTLSASNSKSLIDGALDAQISPVRPFGYEWRDLLNCALQADLLSDAQLIRLCDQSTRFTCDIKSVVRPGAQGLATAQLTWHDPRINADLDPDMEFSLQINGRSIESKRGSRATSQIGSDRGGTRWFDIQWPDNLPASFNVEAKVAFRSNKHNMPCGRAVAVTKTLSIPTRTIRLGEAVDLFKTDPALRAAMRASCPELYIQPEAEPFLHLQMRMDHPPLGLAAHLILLQNGREFKVGSLCVDRDSADTIRQVWRRPDGLLDGPCKFIFRPSQDVADNNNTLIACFWGEEISYDAVVGPAPAAVHFNLDPTLRPAIEKSVAVRINTDGNGQGLLEFTSTKLPVPVSYLISLRQGDKIRKCWIGRAGTDWASTMSAGSLGDAAIPLDFSKPIDVLLTPVPDFNRKPADPKPWGFPIEIKAIPLTRPPR